MNESNARAFSLGLIQEQAARELDISLRSVQRLWRFARAWLFDDVRTVLDGES
jgi:hypothetical protein